jgi:hypothetical protein
MPMNWSAISLLTVPLSFSLPLTNLSLPHLTHTFAFAFPFSLWRWRKWDSGMMICGAAIPRAFLIGST